VGGLAIYKDADTTKKIKEIIASFKNYYQNVSTAEPVISEITIGEKKIKKVFLIGSEQTACLYLLVNKQEILAIEALLESTGVNTFRELEAFISNIEIKPAAIPVAAPVATTAPAAAAANSSEATQASATGQNPSTPAPAVSPEPAAAPAAPPVPVEDPRAKNKELFVLPIYSKDYKIKLGMEYEAVKTQLKDRLYSELTPEKVKALVLYKFKLLKSRAEIKEKYADALTKVEGLKVIEASYADKKLVLFFFEGILYSIKVREEGVVPADFDISMGKLARALSGSSLGKIRRMEYGITFKLQKENGNIIEYSSYSFDTSAEMTIYIKKTVSKIEREIRKILRNTRD
jgi:hypothetical protein